MKVSSKMLGDAGEHYAVSRITFAGMPATKMPDGWQAYDLAVETGAALVRVSVKRGARAKVGRRANGLRSMTAEPAIGLFSSSSRLQVPFARGSCPSK